MNKVKKSLVALRGGIMRPHARSLLLAAVTILLTSAQPAAAQPPPPPGTCFICDGCEFGSGEMCVGTGTLPADGPFFFASQSSGDVLLRRKCDGAFVARLSRGESRFALLEVAPELAIVAARDRRELAQSSQQPEG